MNVREELEGKLKRFEELEQLDGHARDHGPVAQDGGLCP